MGPFTLEDCLGIITAVPVPHQLIKPVRYKDYLQRYIPRRYSAEYGGIWIAGVLVLRLATFASADRKMVVTTTPTRGTWCDRFMRGSKKQTVSINRDNFGLIRKGDARSTGRLGIILVHDKVIIEDKGYQGPGGVCDPGIFLWINRVRGTADIVEGPLVFLGRDSPSQNTKHNAHVEGGGGLM